MASLYRAVRLRYPRVGGGNSPQAALPPIPALRQACSWWVLGNRAKGIDVKTVDRADVSLERQRDTALIAGLARHDEKALRTLIDTCGKYVYGKALQILQDPRLAEEVAQDTLLVLWWSPERFDSSKGSIRSMLMGIARYKAIDRVRKEEGARSKESLLADATRFFESPSGESQVEDAMVVRSAVSSLPHAKREVIFLAFYRGLTYREVAEVLGLPEGTVKTRMRDSLVRLRAAIAPPETA